MKVLVTGASGGIGSACIKNLISRTDVEVIAVSKSANGLIKLKEECFNETKKEIHTVCIDFMKPGFQNEIAANLESSGNVPDCVLNNAGLLVNKKFMDVLPTDLTAQLRINFEAPFFLIQALMPLMQKSKGTKHFVNIGSMGGFQGSEKFSGLSAYSSSKGALAILTECLAAEFKETNSVFNCLALGSADTKMLREAFPEYQSKMSAESVASYISDFLLNGHKYFNGKVIPVAGLET